MPVAERTSDVTIKTDDCVSASFLSFSKFSAVNHGNAAVVKKRKKKRAKTQKDPASLPF